MFYYLLVTALVGTGILTAQIEIPREYSEPPVRLTRLKAMQQAKAAATRPLWVDLAGKRVLGNRAMHRLKAEHASEADFSLAGSPVFSTQLVSHLGQ